MALKSSPVHAMYLQYRLTTCRAQSSGEVIDSTEDTDINAALVNAST